MFRAYLSDLRLQATRRGHVCPGFHPGVVSEDRQKAKAGRVVVPVRLLQVLGQNGGVVQVELEGNKKYQISKKLDVKAMECTVIRSCYLASRRFPHR